MTISINFVNMATSEVLFSYPLTEYGCFSTSVQESQDTNYMNEKIKKSYLENYKQIVSDIVTN